MADLLQSGHGFRMQLCMGRGAGAGADVDALEPAAGAPHSDVFRVTTLASDSAWGRPIMGIPTGRHHKFNPSSRTTDKGRMTVRLLDEPLDPADDSERWVSAFLHTADAKDQLARLKAIIWETRDFGVTWTFYFTGRVNSDGWESGTNIFVVELGDLSEDLEFDVFVGIPHIDANGGSRYAYPQPCLPVGLPFDYLGLTPVDELLGTATTWFGHRRLINTTSTQRARRASVTAAFKALADFESVIALGSLTLSASLLFTGDQCHVFVYPVDSPGTEYGPYPLRALEMWAPSDATDDHWRARTVYAEGFDDGIVADQADASHPALVLTDAYEYRIVKKGAVTEAFPMLIGRAQGIHPVQMFKDICLGFFSRLDDAGDPAYTMAINDAAFDALIADPTFGVMHGKVGKVWVAIEYIEDVICTSYGVGWYLDGEGLVTPVDLRHLTTPSVEFAITESDLVDDPEAFSPGGEVRDAITRVDAKYYVDQLLSLDTEKGMPGFPDIPNHMTETVEVPIEYADFTPKARDIGDQAITWDAESHRLGVLRDGRIANGGLISTNDGKRAALVASMLQMIADRRRPFRSKPNTYRVLVDRTEAMDAIRMGMFGTVQADRLVDPDTHARGGTRFGLCISVEVIDPNTLGIDVLDYGPDPAVGDPTDVPVLDNYAIVVGSDTAVEVDVTRNATGDSVMLRIAETATSVADVGDVPDDAWRLIGTTDRDRQMVFDNLAGPRVWLQGRSEPGLGSTTGITLPPSAWVSPDNAEFVDLDQLDPPTAGAVSAVTDKSATFTWTPAAQGFPLELWYGEGTLDGTTILTSGQNIGSLPPGSSEAGVFGLAGPSTAVTLGVRHVDPTSGKVSAFEIETFNTASGGTLVAPRMAAIGLLGDA